MPLLPRLASLWRNLLRRPQQEQELNEELDAYLELLTEQKRNAGLMPEAARRAALLELGGKEQVKEQVRETRIGYWLETLWQDVRFAVRVLRKQPGFTLIAILTLALGIGTNTAIFSVVNAVLLRPLNFKEPEQLVWLWGTVPKFSQANHSPVEFLAFQSQPQSFTELAAYRPMSFTLTGDAQPEQVQGMIASANYFTLLGVPPWRGRSFQSADGQPAAPRVAVLGYDLWQSRFGGDERAVGRTLTINDEAVAIIGVMPPQFSLNPVTKLWLNPRQGVPDFLMNFRGDVRTLREQHYLRLLGRLKPGVSLIQAQDELDALAARLEQQHTDQRGHGARLVSLSELFIGDLRQTLWLLFGAVILVLLIACGNVTNLSLARAMARTRELTIRAAVGASRFRLLRQLLVESLLLALAGGLVGWLLSVWGLNWLLAQYPDAILRAPEIKPDVRVLLFTLAVAVGTGVLFGLLPGWLATRRDLTGVLKESPRHATGGAARTRLRQSLIVAEVALALVVLVSAGLLVRSFARLTAVEPGFDAANLTTFWLTLTGARYGTETANVRFLKDLTARLEALPGVQAIALSNDFPIQGTDTHDSLAIEGRNLAPAERLNVGLHVINPRYFAAMGTRLLQGRAFDERDNTSAPPVVMVNEAMAQRLWPNENPLGKRLRFGAPDQPWSEVVGVVANLKHDGLQLADSPHCYAPHLQQPWPFITVALRSSLETSALLAAVRQTVQQLDPKLPLIEPLPMTARMERTLATRRLTLTLYSLFAVIALLLATIGLYGVMAYSVAQRTHELGIRVALGATARDVFRLILRQGMTLVALGIAVGIISARLVSGWLAAQLFGVTPADPLTFAALAALLALVALVACWIPAWRATTVDPMIALRCE
ncbi:MAG: ABC transporter permease [Blastocatellia bacterium]